MPVIITGGVLKKNIVHDQGFEGLSRKPRRAAAAAPLQACAGTARTAAIAHGHYTQQGGRSQSAVVMRGRQT